MVLSRFRNVTAVPGGTASVGGSNAIPRMTTSWAGKAVAVAATFVALAIAVAALAVAASSAAGATVGGCGGGGEVAGEVPRQPME